MPSDRFRPSFPPSPTRPGAACWPGSPPARPRFRELAEPYDMSMAAISKHLKVLEKAGLVEQGHHAQYRPRTPQPRTAQGSRRLARRIPPKLWEERLDRLDNYLKLLQKNDRDD